MSDRKRSRFDQTDSGGADTRRSRFDRRSRSPAERDAASNRRSRSPQGDATNGSASKSSAASSAAAAAAAAAAKINAQLQAKKAAGQLTPTPVRPVARTASSADADSGADGGHSLKEGIYEQDGDFIKDIEVNDLRNRYTLTKGATQKMIKEKTGADVTTRGAYYPDKSMATAANPPLYLHITSQTKEGLEAAIAEIEEMMKQALPNLIDDRRNPRARPQETFERDERGRRKWPDEKIPIPLEPINGFNLRAQVVGQGGMYVKHIQSESGARVQIKGRGSGFYEHDTGIEADEPMFLHVTAPEQTMVDKGKELCLDLLENVKQQYEEFKERDRNRGYGGRGGGGGGGYGNRDGGYGGRPERSDSYGGGYGGQSSYGGNSQYGGTSQYGGQPGGAQSPGAAAQSTAGMTAEQQQWMAWAAANPDQAQQYYAAYYAQQGQAGGADPYAAYGGYDAYVRMYQQNSGYGQTPTNGSAAPPPPPGGNDAAPPPPPSGNDAPPPPPGTSGYSNVPPPPGL